MFALNVTQCHKINYMSFIICINESTQVYVHVDHPYDPLLSQNVTGMAGKLSFLQITKKKRIQNHFIDSMHVYTCS